MFSVSADSVIFVSQRRLSIRFDVRKSLNMVNCIILTVAIMSNIFGLSDLLQVA